MKKITSVILCVILLIISLTVFASADSAKVYFSEDMKNITYNNVTYTKKDCSTIGTFEDNDYYISINNTYLSEMYSHQETDVGFHPNIEKNIKGADVYIDNEDMYINATIYMVDGSITESTYISEKYMNEYIEVYEFTSGECTIEFYDMYQERTIDYSVLIENPAENLRYIGLPEYEQVYVYPTSSSKNFNNYLGQILKSGEDFYYLDYSEAKIYDPFESSYLINDIYNEGTIIPVHKITNTDALELFAKVDSNYYSYYYDGERYGELYSIYDAEEFTMNFTAIFLLILFGAVPLAIGVITLVFGIQKKKEERKILFVISGISFAVIILFITVSIMLLYL